jgi:hypothetical protein
MLHPKCYTRYATIATSIQSSTPSRKKVGQVSRFQDSHLELSTLLALALSLLWLLGRFFGRLLLGRLSRFFGRLLLGRLSRFFGRFLLGRLSRLGWLRLRRLLRRQCACLQSETRS